MSSTTTTDNVVVPVIETVTEIETQNETEIQQKLSPLEELLAMMDEQEQAQREFQNAYNHLNTIARNLKKAVQKYTKKEAKRGNARRARRLGLKEGRKPCGFEIPTSISDQLAVFLGKEPGVQIARTEVTKAIAQYIRENNLKHPEKKRVIVPDAKLGAILGEGATDENLNHFSMNKYLTKHFPPKKINKVDA